MLNDWGIHHVHLGATVEADGFVQRTGDVLFVMERRYQKFRKMGASVEIPQ